MRRVFLILIICLINQIASAQLIDSAFQTKMLNAQTTIPKMPITEFLIEFKATGPFTEALKIPTKIIYRPIYGYNNNEYQIVDSFIYDDKGFMAAVVGITVEPRLNLYPNKKSTFFIKTPISFAISVAYPGTKYYDKSWGSMNLNMPILIGYGRNLNANSENSNLNGFSFSLGYQFLRGPILGAKRDLTDFKDYKSRKNWFMPLIGFDYYWLTKKSKAHGISFLFSPSMFYFKVAYSFRTKRSFEKNADGTKKPKKDHYWR